MEAAYSFIVDKNLVQLDSQAVFTKALQGMQHLLGSDLLSFEENKKRFVISSQGKSLTIGDVSLKTRGAKELAQVFTFGASNPTLKSTGRLLPTLLSRT